MKKILACLDDSPRAPSVLWAAIDLATRTGAKVTLLRVATIYLPNEMPPVAFSMSGAELRALIERHASEYLERAAAEAPAGVIEARRVVIAAPWQGICDVAREIDADLIVIGSHGYGVADRVLGTTAAKVVNHADRSVLVVRAPERLR
jgi:nucleotide-binding universal stress UspA family protein